MFNFLQTCQVLKNAVSMKDVPKYEFISEKEISDDCRLTQKVKENHKRWLKRIKKPLPLICKGCCEIDNFTGNELLRIFHDLIDKKNKRRDYCFKPGNLLYFSKSRKFCAAVMFTKTKLLVTTPSPKTIAVDNDDEHYQRRKSVFLYTKLFDDRKVEYYKNKQNKYQSYYSDTIVEDFRKEAMEKFSLFLISKVSEFNLFLFGSSFLAMLFHTAYNISRQKNPHFQSIDFDIPFAACVNFAFCNNMTGKLTDLFGDVRFRKNCGTSKLKHIKETARELIKRAIPPAGNGMWNQVEVKIIAKKLNEFYMMNQSNHKTSSLVIDLKNLSNEVSMLKSFENTSSFFHEYFKTKRFCCSL